MPICQTKFHGPISFEPEQVLQVPAGLFGFTEETQFLLLELPSSRPLAFLQSVQSSNLCFLCLPAQVIDSSYRLSLHPQDLERFGYSEGNPPVMGKDVLCLSLLTVGDHRAATANLAAPLLIDIAKHRGMQAIVAAPYSHEHPLPASGACVKC